jgi:hypothetical protein
VAERELSVAFGLCLDRRIPDMQVLTDEISASGRERDNKHAKADWQFTTTDALVKLKEPCLTP